jgi:DNA-binding NarL/FixJ family response regulator
MSILEAGISGYLLKGVSANELYTAIREVQNGNTYYCKEISNNIFKSISAKGQNGLKKQQPLFTQIEEKIIQAICLEMTSKQISEILFVSPRTVEGHRYNIMKKMGVRTNIGVVLYAIKRGVYKIKIEM